MILLEAREISLLLGVAMPISFSVWVIPVALASGSIPVGAILSASLMTTVLIGIYEWTHYLIHTAYRPHGRYYRTIWRTHRLHHFKNERFWHGITNPFADQLLGTFPNQREIARSETARTLDPGLSGKKPGKANRADKRS